MTDSKNLFERINEYIEDNPSLEDDAANLLVECRMHLIWLESGREHAQMSAKEANARADLVQCKLDISEITSRGFQTMMKSMKSK